MDLAELSSNKPKFLADLKHALVDVGFIYLKNVPGFDVDTQNKLFALGHKFYEELPQETRLKYEENKHFFGYMPPKVSELLQEFHFSYDWPEFDPKDESIPLHKRVVYGPNNWPSEQDIAGFKEAFESHLKSCDNLNKTLQHATAEMLGLPETAFDKYFWGPNDEKLGFCSVRVLHYTPLKEASEERQKLLARAKDGDKAPLSLPAHRDSTAFFTLLINDSEGLEVLNHAGQWIQAPPLPGHVIVNIGVPLMQITSGYLLATLHRVNANLATKNRISIPCFLSPNTDIEFQPIPELSAKLLTDETASAITSASHNLKAWNNKDAAKRIVYQRRISHPVTMERYWPEVAKMIDDELAGSVRISY